MTHKERLRRSRAEARRIAAKRQADPQWYADYLARNADYRRTRAANDDDYRHRRNEQAK